MKPVILCALYKELISDASTPTNLREAEIDERMRMILEWKMLTLWLILDIWTLEQKHATMSFGVSARSF